MVTKYANEKKNRKLEDWTDELEFDGQEKIN
jgi:hypothetical protein